VNQIDFFVVPEEEWQVEHPHRGKNLSEAHAGKGSRMELTDSYLSERVQFIAGHPASINPKSDLPLSLLANGFLEFLHGVHPRRAFGRYCGKLDRDGLRSEGDGTKTQQKIKRSKSTSELDQNILLEEEILCLLGKFPGPPLHDPVDEANVFEVARVPWITSARARVNNSLS